MSKKKPLPQTGRGATKGKPKAPAKKAPKKKTGGIMARPETMASLKAAIANTEPRIVQGMIGQIDGAKLLARMAQAGFTPDPAPPAKVGRPSLYSVEIMTKLCGMIASGTTLTEVCKGEDMPHISTVIRWLSDTEDRAKDAFRAAYACAREAWIQQMADETLAISDDSTGDVKMVAGRDGELHEAMDAEFAARSKLRVDTRKWLLSKLSPAKYGDKVTTILEGGDKPIEVSVGQGLDFDRIRAKRVAVGAV